MTIDEWLERREPRPPAELMQSLKAAVAPSLSNEATETAAVFLAAAERKLRELVKSGQAGRPIATELLTIDALTTYALESATETLQSLGGFSDDAMKRLADVLPPDEPHNPNA